MIDADSSLSLTNTAVATSGEAAFGVRGGDAGTVQIAGGSVETTGAVARGVAAVNGGNLTVSGTAIAANGAGSSTIYLAGSAANAVSLTGGSLSAADGAIVLSEGGTGVVSIGGGDSDPGDWFLRSHIKSEDPNGPTFRSIVPRRLSMCLFLRSRDRWPFQAWGRCMNALAIRKICGAWRNSEPM